MTTGHRKTITVLLLFSACLRPSAQDADRKSQYVDAVVRGAGYMPWQERGPSAEERAFREEIEARKDRMLATRAPVEHPVMLTEAELAQARRNLESSTWARAWFEEHKKLAEFVVSQPDGYVESMIPELTPWFCYGMTCPNCVGVKSQEAMGRRVRRWSQAQPDVIECRYCGHEYPDPEYPETGKLVCPRSGQEFTFYFNEEERRHPDDRSGRRAWHWVGRPTHVSFTGEVRVSKVNFMIRAARSLALAYRFTGDNGYAERAVAILVRLAHCYRRWLYHDYWDSVADCDPLYAAWHDRELRLEWKRHLCTEAYKNDTADQAAMLKGYWGAGRLHPSCDNAGVLVGLALAYDLVHDAVDTDGRPLWTAESRAQVERDLFVEWLMGGEPFLGGAGKATNVNNKSGRVYHPMAYVAKCLGITEWADTALTGFEALAAKSLAYDGFSHESPAYTFSSASYLGNMLGLAEALHGFRWPEAYAKRSGVVDLYRDSERFRLLMRAQIDCLRPDGFFPPLSDTPVRFRPNRSYVEVGLKRLPEHYEPVFSSVYPRGTPSEYAVLHLDAGWIEQKLAGTSAARLPELHFPAWMTAILRHGQGPKSAMLTLHASPHGGHRHADNLSIFYMSGGRTLLGDHGYIGDTPMNGWMHQTFSHSLVIVDGRLQNQRKPQRVPQFHLMAVTPRVSVAEASSQVYEQCGEYRRLVALVKGPGNETFAVDVFRVKGGTQHAYRIFSELGASDAAGNALRFEGISLPPEPPLPQVGASTRKEDIYGLRDVRRAESVPNCWQALWQQEDAAYRLWILTQVNAVEASNGPGQEGPRQSGRRVRYVDAIRTGEPLSSTFVALHEPCRPDGIGPVRRATCIAPPATAGADAVALKIESDWGTCWVFLDFAGEAEIDGIRFQGDLGVFCRVSDLTYWLLGVGATTLCQAQTGFDGMPGHWRGEVSANTESVITTGTARPEDWPELPPSCQAYVRVHDGSYHTGFPVAATSQNTVTVRRFPLPPVSAFELPAVRYLSLEQVR